MSVKKKNYIIIDGTSTEFSGEGKVRIRANYRKNGNRQTCRGDH